MKPIDKVCPYNQYSKLIDLGVINIGQFSVAELGIMLPSFDELSSKKRIHSSSNYVYSTKTSTGDGFICSLVNTITLGVIRSFTAKTEAEARASMLIYLIEQNFTTVEEVNKRLLNS